MAPSERILIISVAIIIIGALVSLRVFWFKRRMVSIAKDLIISNSIPFDGLEVPLLTAFSGLKALAPVTFWQNSIYPWMVLYDDHFDYKVLLTKSARYDQVESLRSYRSRFYNRITFKFTNTDIFFSAVILDEELLEKLLNFFAAKNIHSDAGSRL